MNAATYESNVDTQGCTHYEYRHNQVASPDYRGTMKNYKIFTIWYDSIGAIEQDVCQKPMNLSRFNSSFKEPAQGRGWFASGREGARIVIDRVANGWPAGRQEAELRASRIRCNELKSPTSRIIQRRRKRRRGDVGSEIDMDRVYQGQLDTAWEKMEKVARSANVKAVTLFINVGGVASVKFDDSMWRSAATIKIFELLTMAGRSLRVVVGSVAKQVYQGGPDNMLTCTAAVVKDYGEPLSVERLAAMSNIGFHRVFNFRARLAGPWTVSWGMGSTVNETSIYPYPLFNEKYMQQVPVIHLGTCLSEEQAQIAVDNVANMLREDTI